MRRVAAAAALALAALAGTARADTFAVVPDSLPTSTRLPNSSGSLTLPTSWDSQPAVEPALSFPELSALWHQAGAAYGIPWQVLAAINKIESNFGRNMGPSSAGAVGWMQFLPSTWLRWGMDADGDGVADPWNPYDAVYSAARYLAAAGGASDITRAIFAYNHADWYVREVVDLASLYGGVRLDAWAARARSLQRQLREAQRELAAARARTQGAVFTPGGSTLFGTPFYSGGYVFPVGGGPSVVSVGHTHHDYPAADIAAPAGSPLYALANGLVRKSWAAPEGNCGIGFSFDTDDGQTWTYCHLSYLEPAVQAGAVLTAGQPVGLVGSTGHATGPHLHLQLDPTVGYPQDEPWFQSFAGSAFSWQDQPTSERTLSASFSSPVFAVEQPGPVFAVVPSTAPASDDGPVFFTRLGG
jgi:murein DD-endopeptidase MepM/ murein hydrolase activator NlpD